MSESASDCFSSQTPAFSHSAQTPARPRARPQILALPKRANPIPAAQTNHCIPNRPNASPSFPHIPHHPRPSRWIANPDDRDHNPNIPSIDAISKAVIHS
jgi:hypothetical protein